MPDEFEPLELVLAFNALHGQAIGHIERNLSIHGISFTELLVLHALHGADGESMRRIDLADAVGMSASAVTRLLKPMEKLHLVEKQANPRDARGSLVSLSRTGKTLYQDAVATARDATKSWLGSLTGEQRSGLLALAGAL